MEKVLKEENAKISNIIISHWHHDHIGGLKNIRERKLIDENCRVWKFRRTEVEENFSEMGLTQLKDEQEFYVDENNSFKVFLTKGHTTDHAILYDANRNFVYSGDCILGEGTSVFEDLYDYMNSLEKILQLKPKLIYPGHGNLIEDAVEKIEFYIAHRNQREHQILAALTTADHMKLMDIVAIVYKDTPKHLWTAASVNVHHHLTKLVKESKVEEITESKETFWKILQQNKL